MRRMSRYSYYQSSEFLVMKRAFVQQLDLNLRRDVVAAGSLFALFLLSLRLLP